MYVYRDVQGNDFEQICLFPQNEEELFYMFPRASYPLRADDLRACASERIEPTVFLSDGNLAGYANIIKVEQGSSGSIGNIIVAPSFRGKGLGRYILDVMIQKLKDQFSIKEARLACYSINVSGLTLYHKYGFIPYSFDLRSDYKGENTVLIHLKKEFK